MTSVELRDRVSSVCVTLGYAPAHTPFSFDLQPTGDIHEVFRIEAEALGVIGGFNFTEERTDRLTIWIARKHAAAPSTAYQALITDTTSIRAAVIRDGAVTSGEYSVPDDGWAFDVQRADGQEFATARLALACNYETTV